MVLLSINFTESKIKPCDLGNCELNLYITVLHLSVDEIKSITGKPEWKKECFRSPSHQAIQSNRNYCMF